MTLWTTLTKYGMSMLTKSEAKSIISDLELKPMDVYAACVQRDYAKVMTEEKKHKRNKRIEIKPIDEAIDFAKDIVEELVEIKAEQPTVAKAVEDITVHEVVIKEEE
jgi:hypothetical protein